MTVQIEIKERPILFSGPMVKAILAGRKTQTRRVVKPQPHECHNGDLIFKDHLIGSAVPVRAWGLPNAFGDPMVYEEAYSVCPYGRPGDRLWVREKFMEWQGNCEAVRLGDIDEAEGLKYIVYQDHAEWDGILEDARGGVPWQIKPAIHMPRWASRLTLEVSSVKVERLQQISEEDALAEGVKIEGRLMDNEARWQFQQLWDSINGKREGASWAANPWVWVVGFNKI